MIYNELRYHPILVIFAVKRGINWNFFSFSLELCLRIYENQIIDDMNRST